MVRISATACATAANSAAYTNVFSTWWRGHEVLATIFPKNSGLPFWTTLGHEVVQNGKPLFFQKSPSRGEHIGDVHRFIFKFLLFDAI